jgi:hypothetical protein
LTTSPKRDSAGRELFDRIVPAWRDALPSSVPRAYFDSFVVRNRDALLRRFDALAGQPTVRPGAGREAVKALAKRLVLMPQAVRLGSAQYHSPDWMAHEDELEIRFQGERSEDGVLTMTLHAAPREGDELDLRGVLTHEDGRIVASFDWEVLHRRELIMLRETSLARWFSVTTTPERTMAPSLLEALAVLRAEEDSSPGTPHPWEGVSDLNRDALIARGLAAVVEDEGGPPRYKTTPAGRQRLAQTNTYITPRGDPEAIAREEAHMGRRLRAGRDREEGGKRFTPAIVYPLRFSPQSLAHLSQRLGGANMPARLQVAGYDFDRASVTIDETGFVLVTYRTAARDNPRPVRLANGIETKPFVPGPLVVFITPKGTEAVFSIELQRHDGHQVVSSNWVKGSVEDIVTLTSAEVAELVGLERPGAHPH